MKYIRTKDGRVIDTNGALDSQPTNHNLMRFKSPNGQKQITIKMNNVIKQADTIEELCDAFIMNSNNSRFCAYHTHHYYQTFNEAKDFFKKYPELTSKEVYGAIWTDKGLTYVAKMNEKGELELL